MADLLHTLVQRPCSSQAHHPLQQASSNESFHSTGSQPTRAASSSTSNPPAAPQKKGLPIFEVNSYLSDPSNASLLAAPTTSKPSPKSPSQLSNVTTWAIDPAQPVPLGTKTSHHVPALNTLCQSKGVPTPVFDLEQQGEGNEVSFGGIVRVGEGTVGSAKRWRNKKEAKEGLAELAIGMVKEMTPPGGREAQQTKTSNAGSGRNWVAMLQEYHNSTYGGAQSPVYNYFSLGSMFSATCTIPSHPDRIFGSQSTPFMKKKAAQGNAAKGAVELLISEGKLDEDGTVLSRKKNKLGTSIRLVGKTVEVKKHTTYGQRVNDILPFLNLPQAQYRLSSLPEAPNMVSGYATFPYANEIGRLEGQLGEVRHVYGKKNAREEIAKGVWELLRDVAEQRGFAVKDVDGDLSLAG
ncbi:MAG: hypothetical protein Q9217_002857 [Psora testacea]